MQDLLIKKLSEIYDEDQIKNIIHGLHEYRYTTFRINTLKSNDKMVLDVLNCSGIPYTKINLFDNSYIISDNNNENIQPMKLKLESLDIYKNGHIYVQSLSSMIPPYIIDPNVNENILDMCAAPGGKTTLIQMISNNKSNLTAVELHKDRFERLKYNVNIQKANAYIININACDLSDELRFDKILLDAPCSGSGIIDLNDEEYKKRFTAQLIDKCVKTQKKLISKASKLVRDGGIIVYSTCSLLKDENEDMVNFALNCGLDIDYDYLKNVIQTFNLSSYDNIVIPKDLSFIKIFPNELFEGFFVTRFIKNKH